MLGQLERSYSSSLHDQVTAVGHRVVHGLTMSEPLRVAPEVLAAIDKAATFAPLHNPANAQGIRAAQAVFGATPQAGLRAIPAHHIWGTLCQPAS